MNHIGVALSELLEELNSMQNSDAKTGGKKCQGTGFVFLIYEYLRDWKEFSNNGRIIKFIF